MTDAEKIKEAVRLLREAGAYAITWWTVDDVMQSANDLWEPPSEDFDPQAWLESNESDIQDAMCEVGWTYLNTYVEDDAITKTE